MSTRFEPFLVSELASRVPIGAADLAKSCHAGFEGCRHGDVERWLAAIDRLPELPTAHRSLDTRAVTVGEPVPAELARLLTSELQALRPWRKGPFELHGVSIDTEWRSWMKWDRLTSHVDFTGTRVLDLGCGNGYYGWRMLGAGAATVTGVDPTPLYVAQFFALRRLLGDLPNWVLPLRAEALEGSGDYDRVLSMGVLYHHRAPLQHLADLRRWCRPEGQVIVETLTVPGDDSTVLTPRDRYARMRNVWHIPSPEALCRWLERAGFRDARIVDVTTTSTDEQRATDWMPFHSLADFLDPDDPSRSIEGYPAPCRAIAIAER